MNGTKIIGRVVSCVVITGSLVAPLVTLSGVGAGAASSVVRPCSRLVVAAGSEEGAGGTGAVVLLLGNAGSKCVVEGYPRVEFVTAHGVVVDTRNLHRSSMIFAEPPVRPVVLVHGAVASVGVSWTDTPVNGEACPQVAWSDVSLSNGVGSFSGNPAVWAAPCGGWLMVTPIEFGPTPRMAE